MKYFLYARKSTEDEERQVMSIEAQLAELAEFAKRENLEVVEKFIESKSAKKPGRQIFNEMMSKVQEIREPVGLLAWHPDRLARNSVDGGLIIYSIDIGKIASLRFPTFWFEPTPQGLFMLQVAFGQSKYYSDNLSENVKRGIRQKLRRGEWPGLAPIGYTNNLKTHNIEPDPVKAKVVSKAFEEFAEGCHTLESLQERLSFWGVVSKSGKPIAKSMIQHMLTNPVYIGLIKRDGECHEGNFPPIVSQATFEAVQKVLLRKSRPRKSKQPHDFPFTGLFRCGECGGAITAQYAINRWGTRYTYYRCTKKFGKCTQGYLQERLLAEQVKERLQTVALCEDWKEKMLGQIEMWRKEKVRSSHTFAQNLENKIKEVEQKLDKLVNAFLEGTIEKDTYLVKKEELLKNKTALLEKKGNFGRKGNNWIEPLRNWILSAHYAEKLALSEDFHQMKIFVEKSGSNPTLFHKRIGWDWQKPWPILAERNENSNLPARQSRFAGQENSSRNPLCTDWQGVKESNPRKCFWRALYYHYTNPPFTAKTKAT